MHGRTSAWPIAAPRQYLSTLRQVLDHAAVEPNPAREGRIRLPRQEKAIVEPPSGEQVEAIIVNAPSRGRLPLRVLEQTGMRVGEVHQLEWRDVDVAASRFRIRHARRPQRGAGSKSPLG